MVTAIRAIKRQREDAINGDHNEMADPRPSIREYSATEVHNRAVDPDLPHGITEFYARTVIPTLPHKGYTPVQIFPETEMYGQFLNGDLCAFCRNLDKTTMEDRFAELVTEWRKGIGGLSSPRAITSHPAYQRIIQMGEAALPMIFQELRENGGWWYPALRALTGEDPVPDEAKGRPPLNREAWLEWGRRNGYLQP